MDLMYFESPLAPSASTAAGVFAARNNSAVALFTLLSVAWAERMTATSSSNGRLVDQFGPRLRVRRPKARKDFLALLQDSRHA